MSDFIHLHLHSQYSMLDGAIKIDDLISQIQEFNMPAVAVTDHGNLFGAYEFYEKATAAGVKPIIGCEVYITPTLSLDKPSEGRNYHLTVLCMNETGYKNLSNAVTKGYFEGFYRRPRIDHRILSDHSEGLIVLSGCLNSELSRALFEKDMKEAEKLASMYREIFDDRYYLEVQATGLPEQKVINKKLRDIGKKLNIPLVATNDCHFLKKEDSRPHDALLCIQTGTVLSDEKRFRFVGDQYFLKSKDQMMEDLRGYEDAIERTAEVAQRCDFHFETGGYRFPEFTPPEGKTLEEYIRELSENKLIERLNELGIDDEIKEVYGKRLDYELEIICQMGFPGYFLVVADFINFAKNKNIPVGPGRGSAAGSLVAYVLGITEIDPLAHNLLFERFLNPERVSMPDIDVDFCTEGRDEVIRYVIDKYGEDKVAQIGTYGTMSAKAVIKDVGRVLGIPYGEVDKVSKLIPSFRGKVFNIEESIKQVPQLREMIEQSPALQELVELAKPLENMVRHSSTHAAGVVIANKPLADYIPLYRGAKDETVTQFDMNSVEKLGYVKFDFLGLKTLTVINKAVSFIRQNRDNGRSDFDINRITLDDERVYSLLSTGITRGVFQIESAGMRELLTRLKPTCFEDIVALLALYRPGPLDSGMVDEFIKRKNGGKVSYPHPLLRDILSETYGLFVYQEQIMQTASEVADYSLGEADLLRRAMGKKKPEEMKAQKERFISGAVNKGLTKKKARELFDTMEKFAEYSFNKSHSTAYALLTYQTAYLKTYFPAEFMAALMSNEISNTDKVVSSITECKKTGIEVLAPDVNESMSGFTPVDGKIRFGLSAVKNVGESVVSAIIGTREKEGQFRSIFDFCERVESRKLNRRTFESLIKCGAFDSLEPNRARLFESMDRLIEYTAMKQNSSPEGQHSLFSIDDSVSVPSLSDVENWSENEILKNEMDMLGFYVTSHPMAKYADELSSRIDTESLNEITDKTDIRIAGVVRSLDVKHTKSGSGIFGNLVLEDMKGSVEVIIFNDLLRKSLHILEDKVEPVIVRGTVERTDDRLKLIAREISPLNEFRNGSSMSIKFDASYVTTEKLTELKSILQSYPGDSQVFINIGSREECTVIEVGNCTVRIQDELINSVRQLLGEDSVRIG